jgi:hypothetical protein
MGGRMNSSYLIYHAMIAGAMVVVFVIGVIIVEGAGWLYTVAGL